MRITIQHYYDFGSDRGLVGDDLVRAEAWDALRTASSGPFSLPAEREDWERLADTRGDLRSRAVAIDEWLRGREVRTVASYGVGGASLELWMWRLEPNRRLVLADYAPATVSRLEKVFPGAEVVAHDLRADPPLGADVHMFHRIDTEFANSQWKAIFARFRQVPVLFVATELIDLRRVLTEWRHRRRPGQTKAGLIRNRAAMESLWAETHDATRLRFDDLHAWILEPKA